MDSGSKISRELLDSMREQGLDKDGQPKTSYWKARIEAEEGRVRVAELEIELAALRGAPSRASAQPSPAAPAASAPATPKADTSRVTKELEAELRKAKARIAELEKKPAPTKSAPSKPITGDATERVRVLERELRESEQQKRSAQQSLMARIREFQEANTELQKDLREISKSRDRWQEKAVSFETVLTDMRASASKSSPGEAAPLGQYPTVRHLLEWLGVTIEEGRVIAVGEDRRNQISIEVRKGKLARVLQLEQGEERTYQTLELTAAAHELPTIMLPYLRYYEHRSDPRVLDACRLLGKPLATT